jgi:hypothetical protein
LYFNDADGHSVKLTSVGYIDGNSLKAESVLTAAIADANVTLAKIDFFVDEDDMTSDSAVKTPSQQSVKAYVDSEALTLGSYSTKVIDTAYEATTAGFIVAYGWAGGYITVLIADTEAGLTSAPTTLIRNDSYNSTEGYASVTTPIPLGTWWKVTHSGLDTGQVVRWIPLE